MRSRVILAAVVVGLASFVAAGHAQKKTRLNPVIALLEQKQPVFGLYAPANRGAGPGRGGRGDAAAGGAAAAGGGGAPAAQPPAPKQPIDLAKETLAYASSDFVFNGSMEGGLDRAWPAFTDFVKAMQDAASANKISLLKYPLIVKTPEIAKDAAKAVENISRQLDQGVSGIMFVGVESADEVKQGLAAMRFKSKGGTRPDAVGTAPAYWGMSDAQYKQKADLWPLNPDGELINWTIVESKEGLAHVREIAAVKGIGVLWPGAGTLRGVFSSTNAAGERVLDQEGWEHAIQQVLAACKEFNVPCGYPANANDIEMRMKQGFSVFVMNWGEQGFKAIDLGRKAAGRPATNTP